VDNDPQALLATADNAERNRVSDQIECHLPDRYSETAVDLVFANILAGPLIALSSCLIGSLKTGGEIILSGVLEEQAETVVKAYQEQDIDLSQDRLDGWVRLVGKKSTNLR
jgi:ribosomal protein L11 methyltransferase